MPPLPATFIEASDGPVVVFLPSVEEVPPPAMDQRSSNAPAGFVAGGDLTGEVGVEMLYEGVDRLY